MSVILAIPFQNEWRLSVMGKRLEAEILVLTSISRSSGASELAGESEDRRKEGRLSPPINTDTIHELD